MFIKRIFVFFLLIFSFKAAFGKSGFSPPGNAPGLSYRLYMKAQGSALPISLRRQSSRLPETSQNQRGAQGRHRKSENPFYQTDRVDSRFPVFVGLTTPFRHSRAGRRPGDLNSDFPNPTGITSFADYREKNSESHRAASRLFLAKASRIRRRNRAKRRSAQRRAPKVYYENCKETAPHPSADNSAGITQTTTEAGFCSDCKRQNGTQAFQKMTEAGEAVRARPFRRKLQKRVVGQVSAKIYQVRTLRACLKNDREWFKKHSHNVDWNLMKAVCKKQKTRLKASIQDRWSDMRLNLALSSVNPSHIAGGKTDLSFSLNHPVSGFGSVPKLTDKERTAAREKWADSLSKTGLNEYSSKEFKDRFLKKKPLKLTVEEQKKLRQATWDLSRESRDRYLQTVSEMPVLAHLQTGRPDDGEWDEAFRKMEDDLSDFLKKVEDPEADTALLLSFKSLVEGLLKEDKSFCPVAERAARRAEREEKMKNDVLLATGVLAALPCFITGPLGTGLCLAGGVSLGVLGVRQAQEGRDEALGRALTGEEFETIGGLEKKERELLLAKLFLPLAAWGGTAGAGKTASRISRMGKSHLPPPGYFYKNPDRLIERGATLNPEDIGEPLLQPINSKSPYSENLVIQKQSETAKETEFILWRFEESEGKIDFQNITAPGKTSDNAKQKPVRGDLKKESPTPTDWVYKYPAHKYKVSFIKSDFRKIELNLTVSAKAGSDTVDDKALNDIKNTLAELPERLFNDNLNIRVHHSKMDTLDHTFPAGWTAPDRKTIELMHSGLTEETIKHTIVHELGHVLAGKKGKAWTSAMKRDDKPWWRGRKKQGSTEYGDTNPEKGETWISTMERDDKSWWRGRKKQGPSKYGDTNPEEDFAETLWFYVATDGGLKHPEILKRFRHRFEVLDNLMGVDTANKQARVKEIKAKMAKKGLFLTATTMAGGRMALTTVVVEDDEMTIYY